MVTDETEATSPELRARLLVAAFGIPLGAAAAYLGGWYLGVLIAVIAALSAREFYAMVRLRRGFPLRALGMIAALALVLLAVDSVSFTVWGARAFLLLLALTLASFGTTVFSGPALQTPMLSNCATVVGALYTGGTLSFAVLLRNLPEHLGLSEAGPWGSALLTFFPLSVTWAADSAAYFVGKRVGKRRLAPRVSPGKTLAGCVAAVGAAIGIGTLHGWVLSVVSGLSLSLWIGGVIGLVIGVVAQVGDLAESVIKREAGVKDSGSLFPGHGGALDRFDALFFTLPVTYGLFFAVLSRT